MALYDTAKQLTNNSPTVVEIGSLVGKSSFVIAKGLERKTTPKLYCIDPFVGVDPNDKTDFTVREKISQIQNELGVGKYKNTFIAAIHDVYFVGGEHEGPNNIVQQYLVNSPGKINQQWAQQKLTDCLFIAKKIGQK